MTDKQDSVTPEENKEQGDDSTAKSEMEADAEGEKPEGDKPEATHPDNQIDYDAEIDKEIKGRPDPEKARLAFKERQARREERQEEEKDKEFISREEFNSYLERDRQERQVDTFLILAKSLANSDKEATLMLERWKNRSFPSHMTITEQVEEIYAGIHSKRLIGERNEALRALRNKDNANKSSVSAGQQNLKSKTREPNEMPANDLLTIKGAGFAWNEKTKRYEKKTSSGKLLVRDKSGRVILAS